MRKRGFKERATAMMLAVTMILSNTALPSLASEQIDEPAVNVVEAEMNENDASTMFTPEESAEAMPAAETYTADATAEETAA